MTRLSCLHHLPRPHGASSWMHPGRAVSCSCSSSRSHAPGRLALHHRRHGPPVCSLAGGPRECKLHGRICTSLVHGAPSDDGFWLLVTAPSFHRQSVCDRTWNAFVTVPETGVPFASPCCGGSAYTTEATHSSVDLGGPPIIPLSHLLSFNRLPNESHRRHFLF